MRLSGLASRLAGPPRTLRGGTVRAGSLRRECLQAFARTDDYVRLLIAYAAGVRMPGHAKVLVRPPPILVTDVAFAHITRHDEDFFGWPKNSRLAPCHRSSLKNDEPTCTLHEMRCGCRAFVFARGRCRCPNVAFPDQKAQVQ